MSVVAGLLVTAMLAAAGAPLARFLLSPRGALARFAWSYLLGTAAWGALLFAGSHMAGLPLRGEVLRPLLVSAALAGAALECWFSWRQPHLRDRQPRRAEHLLVLALGSLVWIGIVGHATDPTVDTDGRITWTAHAKYMQAEGTVDAAVFRQARWAVAHPRYPPLMPLLQLTVFEAGARDERALKPLYAAYWAALVVLIFDAGCRLAGERGALGTTLLAITMPFPALAKEGGAAGVYSDLPLAAFAGAGLVLLADRRERPRAGVAAGLLLGAAVWTKNEGVVLAAAALLGGLAASWPHGGRRIVLRRWLPALAGGLAAAAILASWQAGIPNRFDEGYVGALALGSFAGSVGKLPTIARSIAVETLDVEAWAVAGPLLVIVLSAGYALGLWRESWVRGFSLAILLGVGSYAVAYLVTGWPIADLVHITWKRFLLQQLPNLMVLTAGALERVLPGQAPAAAPGRSPCARNAV